MLEMCTKNTRLFHIYVVPTLCSTKPFHAVRGSSGVTPWRCYPLARNVNTGTVLPYAISSALVHCLGGRAPIVSVVLHVVVQTMVVEPCATLRRGAGVLCNVRDALRLRAQTGVAIERAVIGAGINGTLYEECTRRPSIALNTLFGAVAPTAVPAAVGRTSCLVTFKVAIL